MTHMSVMIIVLEHSNFTHIDNKEQKRIHMLIAEVTKHRQYATEEDPGIGAHLFFSQAGSCKKDEQKVTFLSQKY